MSVPHGTGEPLDDIVDFLEPFIGPLIERINVEEFTTVEFIEAMQLDEPTRQAYEAAVRHWPERDEFRAKMVIHGQAIPLLLRQSGLVDWAGFAHGEPDQYAIPAWWRKRGSQS
ncbi:MAG TPA: hypothetical protein VKU87_04110 [Thermomicrobiaceae bacterium]|nr:hypothetical protein [Thermomicrobiaceae bacterium]